MSIKTNSFKISLLIIITQFILAGCANTKSSAQASPPPLTLFSNQTQFKDFEVESYEEIFELSDELKAQLVKNIPNKKPTMKTAKDKTKVIYDLNKYGSENTWMMDENEYSWSSEVIKNKMTTIIIVTIKRKSGLVELEISKPFPTGSGLDVVFDAIDKGQMTTGRCKKIENQNL